MTTVMAWILCTAFLISCTYAAGELCRQDDSQHIEGTRCRHYLECENGVWYLKQCSIGQIFDLTTSECKSVSEVECVDTAPRCEEGKVYPHAGSKSLYHLCLDGRISTRYCSVGEVFDPFTQSCKFDGASLILRGLSGRAKRNADEVCTEGSKFRDGISCRNYKECINGKEVVKTCPDCTNYDEVTKRCRFNTAVPCGPNTYTEEPTTSRPVTTEPTTPETEPTVTTQPTTPSTEPPVTTQPTTPATEPPVTTQPTTPATEPPVTAQPTTPATEPPVTTQPTTPATEPPVTTQPTTPATETKPNTGDLTPAESTSNPVTQPEPTTEPVTQPEPTTEPVTQPEPTTEPVTQTEPSTEPVTQTEPTTEAPTTTVLCVEGKKIPLKDKDCKAYKQCVKGVFVDKTCSWGYQFDILKNDCISSYWHKIHCDK